MTKTIQLERLRIGISHYKSSGDNRQGKIDGIGTYTQNLIENLAQLNCNIEPIYHSPLESLISMSATLGKHFNRKIEKCFDIYHTTNYRVPNFNKIPVIATLHDAILLKHPEWGSQSFRALKNWIMKKSVKRAERIIAISKYIVPELVEYWGIKEEKIHIIHNGISDWWFTKKSNEEKDTVLKKFKLKNEFLLCVGTLQPRKNLIRIIQAFEKLPATLQQQHKLVVVGKNGWDSELALAALRQLTDKDKAVWLNYVTQDELRVLYQSAKLFLFPSLNEGFGLPILEAFASDLPVITSNITSMPEIAGDAAYLVDPYSVEEINHAMCRMLTEPGLTDVYRAKANIRVKDFSWMKCAVETLAVYKELV